MEKEKIFLKNLEEITERMLQMRQWAEQATDIIARDGDMPMTAAGARDAFDSIDKLTFYVRYLEEHHTEEDLQQFKMLWEDELGNLSYIYNNLANLNAPLYDDDFKMKMIQLNGEVEEFLKKTEILNQEEKSENIQQAKEQNQEQRNMQKTDVAQKQGEVDKALENQRQESKGNTGKGNEQQEKAIREQVSKNEERKDSVQQSKALDSRTAVQDQARLNERIGQPKTQEQVNTPTQDKVFDIKDNSDEAGRKRIQAMKEKHGIKDRGNSIYIPGNIADIMRSELGNSEAEKEYYEDIRKFIYDYTGLSNDGEGQDIGDFREKTSIVSENKHNAVSEDQKEEAQRKVVPQEEKTKDRVNIQQDKEKVIQSLRKVAEMVDRSHSDMSFKNMMFALKDLADKKLLSKDMTDAYMHIFNNVKYHGYTTDRSILDLSTEIYNQIDQLEKNNKEEYIIKPKRQASNENYGSEGQEKALDPRTASQDQARVDDAFKPQEQNGQQDRKFGDRIRREDVPSFREGVKSITDKYRDQEQKKINREESQHTMTAADTVKTQDEADKVLETQRQVSKENPGKGNEQQERAIREQLKEKEPLERDENAGGKKIDVPATFKQGAEKVKNWAQSNQQKIAAYYMKKRKNEWSDY